jgi:hypothetical protein
MIIIAEGAAAVTILVLQAIWYMLLLTFWAAVFILWGLFSIAKGIYNLATREPGLERHQSPSCKIPIGKLYARAPTYCNPTNLTQVSA